jgi:hypothetical protein
MSFRIMLLVSKRFLSLWTEHPLYIPKIQGKPSILTVHLETRNNALAGTLLHPPAMLRVQMVSGIDCRGQ